MVSESRPLYRNTADIVRERFGQETRRHEDRITVGVGVTPLIPLNPKRIWYRYTNRSGDYGAVGRDNNLTLANGDYIPNQGGEEFSVEEDAMGVTDPLFAIGVVSGTWYIVWEELS